MIRGGRLVRSQHGVWGWLFVNALGGMHCGARAEGCEKGDACTALLAPAPSLPAAMNPSQSEDPPGQEVQPLEPSSDEPSLAIAEAPVQPLCSDSSVLGSPEQPSLHLMRSQAMIDGLAGCEEIWGSLYLLTVPETDLSALSALRVVHGTLTVQHFSDSTHYLLDSPGEGASSLQGLNSLEVVEQLHLRGLMISDLQGLEGLRTVGETLAGQSEPDTMDSGFGDIRIVRCPNLTNLDGMDRLEWYESLVLRENLALEDATGLLMLPRLQTLEAVHNPQLTELPVPGEVVQSLVVRHSGLRNLDRFDRLRSVGTLELVDNEQLVDASGLAGLQSVEALYIGSNPALTTLPDFEGIAELTVFELAFNAGLTQGPRFPSLLGSTETTLRVVNNQILETLDGFPRLESLGTLELVDNPRLRSAQFAALQEVALEVSVRCNPLLPSEQRDRWTGLRRGAVSEPLDSACSPVD